MGHLFKVALIITLTACGSIQKIRSSKQQLPAAQIMTKSVRQVLLDNSFLVVVLIYDQQNPERLINYSTGNAFLVDQNLLITANHVFHLIQERTPHRIVLIDNDGRTYPARLIISDPIDDVALVHASVGQRPLQTNKLNSDDRILYVLGQKGVAAEGEVRFLTSAYLQEAFVTSTDRSGSSHFTVVGFFANGMSGSAVLNLHGQVVGMLVTATGGYVRGQGADSLIPIGKVLKIELAMKIVQDYYDLVNGELHKSAKGLNANQAP